MGEQWHFIASDKEIDLCDYVEVLEYHIWDTGNAPNRYEAV